MTNNTESTATHVVGAGQTPFLTVEITVTEKEAGEQDWEFTENITATWRWYNGGLTPGAPKQGYWLLCGDNMGSEQLVMWPHQVDAVRALLDACEANQPAVAS